MSTKKILILHTSIGLGHKFIAQNIGYQLSEAGCDVKVEDILEVQKGKLVDISTSIHRWMNVKAPWMWSFLYHFTNLNFVSKITFPIRLWVASKNCDKILSLIREFKPDMVISVQTTASGTISYLKKQKLYTGLFGIGFSDFHLHKFWLYPQADFFLANIDEQKMEMVKLGYDEKKIFVCGMALKPKMEFNEAETKNRFNIEEGERVVLMGSGSLGTGFHEELMKDLETLDNVKTIVVCGKNTEVKKSLEQKFTSGKIIFLGFYSPMQELYSIADIFLSKPGGLSTSESLQYGLPLLLTHFLPGQEELNVTYLLGKKLIMYNKTDTLVLIKKELETGIFKNSLKTNPNFDLIVNPTTPAFKAVLSQFG